jgi:hypothetical protein
MNMSGSPFFGPIDLVVKIDADETDDGTCEKVVFSVELRTEDRPVFPTAAAVGAARLPEPTLPVEVIVFDDCGNVQLETLEFTDVGTTTVTVDLPTTQCDTSPPTFTRTFFVIADPSNKVHEATEGNNRDEFAVSCPS